MTNVKLTLFAVTILLAVCCAPAYARAQESGDGFFYRVDPEDIKKLVANDENNKYEIEPLVVAGHVGVSVDVTKIVRFPDVDRDFASILDQIKKSTTSSRLYYCTAAVKGLHDYLLTLDETASRDNWSHSADVVHDHCGDFRNTAACLRRLAIYDAACLDKVDLTHPTFGLVGLEFSSDRPTFCSGVYVGKGWLLTADHCIPLQKRAVFLQSRASIDISWRLVVPFGSLGTSRTPGPPVSQDRSDFDIYCSATLGDDHGARLLGNLAILPLSDCNGASFELKDVAGIGGIDGIEAPTYPNRSTGNDNDMYNLAFTAFNRLVWQEISFAQQLCHREEFEKTELCQRSKDANWAVPIRTDPLPTCRFEKSRGPELRHYCQSNQWSSGAPVLQISYGRVSMMALHLGGDQDVSESVARDATGNIAWPVQDVGEFLSRRENDLGQPWPR